jgi:hypothetical protein
VCSCVCVTSCQPVALNLIPTTTFSRSSEHTLVQTVLPTRTSLTQIGVSLSTVWQNSLLEQLFGQSREKMGGGVFRRRLSNCLAGTFEAMTSNKQHPWETKAVQEAQEGGPTSTYCLVCASTGRVCFASVSNSSQCSVITRTLRTMYTERSSFWRSASLCDDILF